MFTRGSRRPRHLAGQWQLLIRQCEINNYDGIKMKHLFVFYVTLVLLVAGVFAKARNSYCVSSGNNHSDWTCKFPFLYEVLSDTT